MECTLWFFSVSPFTNSLANAVFNALQDVRVPNSRSQRTLPRVRARRQFAINPGPSFQTKLFKELRPAVLWRATSTDLQALPIPQKLDLRIFLKCAK